MASFLIVDGDRNFREALAIALRLDGHHASTVEDAPCARTRLAAVRVDCCLVDVHLRGADALLEAACRTGTSAVATGPYPDLLAAVAARHPLARILAKPFGAPQVEACVPCVPAAGAAAP